MLRYLCLVLDSVLTLVLTLMVCNVLIEFIRDKRFPRLFRASDQHSGTNLFNLFENTWLKLKLNTSAYFLKDLWRYVKSQFDVSLNMRKDELTLALYNFFSRLCRKKRSS